MTRHPIIEEDLSTICSADLPWSVLDGKTVVISGANGLLPSMMVEALLYRNENQGSSINVVGLVRSQERGEKRFHSFLETKSRLTLVQQDISQPLRYAGPADFIVHAASPASPKYYGVTPVNTLRANIAGTENLLELARCQGTERFLFFSSGEVYGNVNSDRVPTREEDYGYLDPTTVRACYAESKRMGENMCVSWHHQYGVPTGIVRPFHTYGPGMALDDGRVFADFVADIVHHRNIEMKSDGKATRAFCYLSDATIGFFTVLLKGANGHTYNVGNPKAEMSILELAETLVQLFPERKLQLIRKIEETTNLYLQSPIPRNSPNIDKVRALGWEPTIGVAEGFRRTVQSFE
jgi:UDP-glucuronate decarboxylase